MRRAAALGRALVVALAVVTVLPAAAADAASSPRDRVAAPGAGAASAPAPCHVPGLQSGALCGSVRRALDPARPGGTAIDVHYVVVPALARNKLPDPVFFLAGGPGQSAIALAPVFLAVHLRLNNRRDLVFVDQRGTGRSASLDCGNPAQGELAGSSSAELQAAEMARCRRELVGRPHVPDAAALGFYTTTIAVGDLDAVRAALGAERVDLIGGSYGTRVGLEWLRLHPDRVRRSVLDGVAPPDMALPASFSADNQAAFDALLAACRAEPACATRHPDLERRWRALLASLPKSVEAPHPLTGTVERFSLTRDMVLGAARSALYAPAFAAALPLAIERAAAGDVRAIVGLTSGFLSRRSQRLAIGMHASVVCAEDVPLLEGGMGASGRLDPPGADFGDAFSDLYRRLCAEWPRGRVDDAFRTIPEARTAVLLLSGSLDPATPPRHGERVALALGAKARHVVVPNVGHGTIQVGCLRDVVFRFVDAADDAAALAVDATCAARIPRPAAFRAIEPADAAPAEPMR